MKVALGGESWTGPAVDLRAAGVPAAAVASAIRGERAGDERTGDERAGPDLSVTCAPPGPVHEYVAVLRPGPSLSPRAALAAAARSRGHAAPQDDALREVRAELSDLPTPDVDLAAVRRRVAECGDEEAALRERAAALRGRVAALREVGDDVGAAPDATREAHDATREAHDEVAREVGAPDAGGEVESALAEAEAALAETARRLSEATTERVAAEQALQRARRAAREAREARARRLQLEDRAGNLARTARAHLAGAVHDAFARAVAAVPGEGRVGDRPGAFEGDPLVAALAVARVADVDAPVVVACDRFPSAVAARGCLDAPVVMV